MAALGQVLTSPNYPALPSLPSPNTCTHTTSRAAHLSKYPAPIHSSPETRNSNHIHPNPFPQNSHSHFTFPRHKRLFTYYVRLGVGVHADICWQRLGSTVINVRMIRFEMSFVFFCTLNVLHSHWLLSQTSFSVLELDCVSFLRLCDAGFSSTVLDLQLED